MSSIRTAYRSRKRFISRTTLSLIAFLVLLIGGLYICGIIPIPRIPSDWYSRSVQSGVDAKGATTRGAMEAKKQHKPHSAINLDSHHVPNKYITSPTGLPLGNYVVMIDAGSSGSRVYVYQYKLPFLIDDKTSKPIPTNDYSADILHVAVAEDINHNPIVRKQEPGLSSYESNPQDAFSSIEKLLEFAAENIPESLHSKTPVYVLATAGLRLTPEKIRYEILDNVRAGLRRWSSQGKFLFQQDDQADMITGELEGLYGWIALNYIYNRFGDLQRTYPTGGLDPHTYATIPRMTNEQFNRVSDQFQANKVKNRPSLSAIIDEPILNNTNLNDNGSNNGVGTVALLEIGGGSAQVAFAVGDGPSAHPPNYVHSVDLNLLHCDYALQRLDNENGKKNSFNDNQITHRIDKDGQKWPVGGHNYNVYTASFLGHGANAARTRYINYLIKKATKNDTNQQLSLLLDPCGIYAQADIVTPKNGWGRPYIIPTTISSKFKHFDTSEFMNIDTSFLLDDQVLVMGTGKWNECRDLLIELLPPTPPSFETDPEKAGKPRCEYHCPINDQYQPILTAEMFEKNQFFGFSEYWFLTRDVIRIEPGDFTGELFELMSQELCDSSIGKQDWGTVLNNFKNGRFPDSANEQRIRQQCFKSAWMSTMLHRGHGLPQNKQKKFITPVSSIEGSEVQWSLGAVIIKVTEQLKQNHGLCLELATKSNKNGLATLLTNAEQTFQEDEQTRLSQTDYWGMDAGWEKAVLFWSWALVIGGLVLICIIAWIYQRFFSNSDSVLYRAL